MIVVSPDSQELGGADLHRRVCLEEDITIDALLAVVDNSIRHYTSLVHTLTLS